MLKGGPRGSVAAVVAFGAFVLQCHTAPRGAPPAPEHEVAPNVTADPVLNEGEPTEMDPHFLSEEAFYERFIERRVGSCESENPPYSRTVVELVFRDSGEIRLDQATAAEVSCIMDLVRQDFPDSSRIEAFPTYDWHTILLAVQPALSSAMLSHPGKTGVPAIDSLYLEYPFRPSKPPYSDSLWLTFEEPLNTPLLAKKFEGAAGVIWSEPNRICCDGSDVRLFRKGGSYQVVLKQGGGDCPAGCTENHYWYFLVNGEATEVRLLAEQENKFARTIHLWNVPRRYPATAFQSVDDIFLYARQSPLWWVRRHAIEATAQLLRHEGPSLGEDWDDSPQIENSAIPGVRGAPTPSGYRHYDELRRQVMAMKQQALDVLKAATQDPDPDARRSAENGYELVTSCRIFGADRLLFYFQVGGCLSGAQSTLMVRPDGCAEFALPGAARDRTDPIRVFLDAAELDSLIQSAEGLGAMNLRPGIACCADCPSLTLAFQREGFEQYKINSYAKEKPTVFGSFCGKVSAGTDGTGSIDAWVGLGTVVGDLFKNHASPIDMCGEIRRD